MEKTPPPVLVAIQRHIRAPFRAQKGAGLAQEQHHLDVDRWHRWTKWINKAIDR